MYERRLAGAASPWTTDPILRTYRFTNTYRAADRVSQFLISEVQYGEGRSQAPAEIFFRTILFKLFNKIDTWRRIEKEIGPLSWQSADFSEINRILSSAISRGDRIYSAAYIMPAPHFDHTRKHENHLALLNQMMGDGLPGRIAAAKSLSEVYNILKALPGIGPFLAFQYTIDLNYSNLLDFDESDFVVAGPGALDGIAKCFSDTGNLSSAEIIYLMTESQDTAFRERGLAFGGLFGRPLKPIDCQNLFCEISKYARVSHPDIQGTASRTRIKQGYASTDAALPQPVFPPRWKLMVPKFSTNRPANEQLQLF